MKLLLNPCVEEVANLLHNPILPPHCYNLFYVNIHLNFKPIHATLLIHRPRGVLAASTITVLMHGFINIHIWRRLPKVISEKPPRHRLLLVYDDIFDNDSLYILCIIPGPRLVLYSQRDFY